MIKNMIAQLIPWKKDTMERVKVQVYVLHYYMEGQDDVNAFQCFLCLAANATSNCKKS